MSDVNAISKGARSAFEVSWAQTALDVLKCGQATSMPFKAVWNSRLTKFVAALATSLHNKQLLASPLVGVAKSAGEIKRCPAGRVETTLCWEC